MITIEDMVFQAYEEGATDIHLSYGLPPRYRKNGQLENLSDEPITVEECIEYAKALTGTDEAYEEYEKTGSLNFAVTFVGSRCRVNLFKQQGLPSASLRILPKVIPNIDRIDLPSEMKEIKDINKGLVLIVGEKGSGKSTTLAAIIEDINESRKCHIVTLEDPIEYIFKSQLAVINQREIGKDTENMISGFRESFTEDPDIIFIGDIKDKETIEAAILNAETGHLIIGAFRAESISDAITHIVQAFPRDIQYQVKTRFVECLQAIVYQKLVTSEKKGKIVPECRMLLVNEAVKKQLLKTMSFEHMQEILEENTYVSGDWEEA